jgi:hypothetical protein
MMIKSILGLIFITSLLFSYTVHELNNPTATVFDITQDPTNLTAQSVTKTMQEVDKIRVAVDMITQIFPREVTQYQCGTDIYNTTYCPKALTLADTYWSYSNGSSIHHTAVVVDNETGTSAKYTGTVIDYVNGTSQPHTNTETNYSNGTAATYNGSVIDYTAKTYTPINSNGTATANTGSVVDYAAKAGGGTIISPEIVIREVSNCQGTETSTNYTEYSRYDIDTDEGKVSGFYSFYPLFSGLEYMRVKNGKLEVRACTKAQGSNVYDIGTALSSSGLTCAQWQENTDVFLGAEGTCTSVNCKTVSFVIYSDGELFKNHYSCPAQNQGWYAISHVNLNGTVATYDGKTSSYAGCSYTISEPLEEADFRIATFAPYGGLFGCSNSNGKAWAVHLMFKPLLSPSICPTDYADNGTNCKKIVSYSYYSYACPAGQTATSTGLASCPKTDPNQAVDNTTTLDDACNNATPPTNNCSGTTVSCALGYTDNTTNCKKTIGYNYYSYGCPTGYAVQNAGLTSCPKTDPNQTIVNQATLDDSCNNATPPANNCVQTLNTTAYEYICGTGYTPLDDGETACPVGTSGACNSATSPISNCKKTISFDYYSYGCDPGYSPLSHGLSTCSKTDPDTTKNNEATLNDNCNSPTPPANNCSNSIAYSYYEYVCPIDINEQEESYSPTNSGLTSCSRTDPNGVVNNSATLDDNCNSATSPANNCKQVNFKCNSNVMKPALINNTWQCSPYYCDSSNKCATAECVNGTPQANGTSYDNSPLNGINNSVICNSTICDAVANERLGRCGLPPKCPTAFGVYASSGNCYQDVCPPNSTERELGGGGTTCLSLQCPTGYVENSTGGCDAE